MRLKQLEIQGFKSFADKVVLEFNSGITSIVGPNGSGKSNVADAIRWVLGEQSSKALRGSKMEDIIFAGTEHRKTMGFAEVSLIVDNYSKSLPIEYSEVKITRRLYRSGESEYYINNTQCRLKDINELFLDTGIGKEGYSIIGQSRVDEILSTKSEDRRYIFEEASGIMKYKLRKIEAEKKLEKTKENLVRINDIINELANQLEPLKEQAETAKKFLSIREKLKILDVNVYMANIEKLKQRINEVESMCISIKQNINTENEKIEKLNDLNDSRTKLIKLRSERLNASKQEYFELEKKLEKYNAKIQLNQEKISNYNKNIERLENEIKDIKNKLLKLDDEEDLNISKQNQLNLQYADYDKKLSEIETEYKQLLDTLSQDERHIENLKSAVMNKHELLSEKKTQINNLDNLISTIAERKVRVLDEISQIDVETSDESIKREEVINELNKVEKEIAFSKHNLKLLHEKKENLNQKLSKLRNLQTKLKSEKQFKESRYKMLINMENNLEGYNRSVKVILTKCKESEQLSAGIHGAVAQLISVDERYETAIEMSLGGVLQNIVTTNEEDAKKAIEFLKKNKIGRATFLPISSVNGSKLDQATISKLSKYQGFCGVAADLVKCDQKYRGIVYSFLGKVVVVDNIDTGIKMARDFRYSFRIVTLDGDILSTRGSITGGETQARGTGILGRSREITKLYKEILKLADDEMELDEEIITMIDSLDKVEAQIEKESDIIKDNEILKARNEDFLYQIDNNISRMKSKSEMLGQEIHQFDREIDEMDSEKKKYLEDQVFLEREIEEIKKVIMESSDKHRENQFTRDKLNGKLTDCKVAVSTIRESIQNVQESLDRLKTERNNYLENINAKNTDISINTRQIESLSNENKGLMVQIKKVEEEKTGKTLEMGSIEEEAKVLEEDLVELAKKIKESNDTITLLKDEFNRLEVRKAKSESELDAIQNRLWDEYELTYNNAIPLKSDIGSITQAQKQINEYRNEIKALGVVNVAAIDDYIKTKERYEFMTTQRDDMEQAQKKLYKIINEMTSLMQQQFLQQFKKINENFNIVYRQLFDGGRAELVLVDENNVLESGIDIVVQPPGKKLQNMQLLSGGEKAFTAIALLFAILKLKPVPFCVLDEIEAALDDSNAYKFSEYLKNYSKETQFILITHRKTTMEISDTLYGVTMQERGVSGIVSLKLDEKAS